uniref:Short-chain dehydrogenase n=2 Tax=Bursaphelenchus xylophilus TaxID=6326 RepID=A0A1I7RTE4_BURXY
MSLKGKVALVTGASRGIGKGIAVEIGAEGATVYVTGRKPGQAVKLETSTTLSEVADEITKRGGKGIAVYVDHSDPEDVKKLFERIDKEQNGQLDILVNNAYSAVPFLMGNIGTKFYEFKQNPEEVWDIVNNVGLRNHYVCSTYAARLMVKNKKGLIVLIGSLGGLRHLFNVAYGVGKDAVDRLAADLAVELQGTGVNCVSVWPGEVRTEYIDVNVVQKQTGETADAFAAGEDIGYSGRAIAKLATDPDVAKYHGKIVLSTELAEKYGVRDLEGKIPQPIYLEERRNYANTINKIRTAGIKYDS